VTASPSTPDDDAAGERTYEGWFWMPGDERRAYGRLECDLTDGPRLRLVGEGFVDYDTAPPKPILNVTAIHGETIGGVQLSVLDFWTATWSTPLELPQGAVVEGPARSVLIGEHVASAADVTANYYVCRLYGLLEFAVGTIQERGPLDVPGADDEHSTPLNVALGDGVNLMLTAERRRGGRSVDFRSQVHVSAQFNMWPARSLPELERDYVQPLQDLVLFATRRQSYLTALSALPESGRAVEALSAADPRPHDTRDLVLLPLNLREHEDPAAVVRGWYDLRARVGPVWETFFNALGREYIPAADQFIPVVSFAEGYHRAIRGECPPLDQAEHREALKVMRKAVGGRLWQIYGAPLKYANARSQGMRLGDLIDRALEVVPDWRLDAGLFRKQVVDTRNWLIHWGDKGPNTVEDPGERALLVHRLVVVIYANLTLDLGFDGSAAERVIRKGWMELP
jgi:hypothetical protein